MGDLRLGDTIDDFCVKCKRLTNHAVVSLLNGAAAKVRCRTCYSDHDYRNEQAPPSKRDLKKAALFNQVLSSVGAPASETAAAAASPAGEILAGDTPAGDLPGGELVAGEMPEATAAPSGPAAGKAARARKKH